MHYSTYLCFDFHLFLDKAKRTEQGNLLGKAFLYSKSIKSFAGQRTRLGSNDGRERTMARHVSQIDHQPDKKKNGIPGYCVLPLQLGAMAKVREQRGRKDIALHVRHIDQRTRHTTLKRESCESHDAERKENITKGTTDLKVEFISQDHSSQFTNLEHVTISESRLSIYFKISTKHQHLD